jgi:dUTPase
MRASKPLKVLYKLTEECLALSNKLNTPLGLESKESFDYSYYIRAIIDSPITINPKELKPINTGLHIIVTDPCYEVIVNSYTNLLKSKGLAIFPCSYYNYGNEIIVLLYNYSDKIQSIDPAEKIGLLSFKEIVLVEAENIENMNKEAYYAVSNLMKNTDYLCKSKDHSWVQKEKIVSKTKNVLNKHAVLKEDSYLYLDKDCRNTPNILFKKGTTVIVKQSNSDGWCRIVDFNNKGGWWIQTSKLEQNKNNLVTYAETIESLIEKRLK